MYHHVAVKVSDLERSTRFYEEVFGARSLWQEGYPPGRSEDSAAKGAPVPRGNGLELIEFTPAQTCAPIDGPSERVLHTCIWVEDVPEAVRLVTEHGGAARNQIMPWHGYSVAMVEDPDGHIIEVVDIDLQAATQLMANAANDWEGVTIELVAEATAS